ncbi:MAG: MinD/ParA family ATP-binding protein [Thermoleophilaceae bacterium]
MPKRGSRVTYQATSRVANHALDHAEPDARPDEGARPARAPAPARPGYAGAPGSRWRERLFRLTRGAIDLAPRGTGAADRELRERIAVPVSSCERVAVLSRKGGVGKTTTAIMLGHVLASHRTDRVVAVDSSPEAGSLAHRIRRRTRRDARQLLAHESELHSHADVRRFTNQAPSRLEVVAAADDSGRAELLDGEEVRRLLALLDPHYDVACIDTGPGIAQAATRVVLEAARQVVVVVPPSIEGSRTAGATFRWLRENGHADLAARGVAVINTTVPALPIDVDDLAAQLSAWCRGVVRVPFDGHLATGGEASLAGVRRATGSAYLELAALVADGFATAQR